MKRIKPVLARNARVAELLQPVAKETIMNATFAALLSTALLTTTGLGQSTILWNESVNGPLSNNGDIPTSLGLISPGTSSILGATEVVLSGNGGATFEDFFTFSIAPSFSATGLAINTDKPVLIWLGNPTFSEVQSYVFNPLNGALLPQLSQTAINPGDYGMYVKVNDFSATGSANYRLDFVVQAIPELGTLWLLLGGLSLVGFRRWRRAH